jgi:N-acetylmuramoyl-L-alanine amidase
MTGNAVTELQKRLTNEGVYSGPITGYFGPLTSAGVKAYQQKYGISQVGTVGPLTRAKLNASQVAGVSIVNTEAIRTQIASLQAQVVVLLQQLLQMLQTQVNQ